MCIRDRRCRCGDCCSDLGTLTSRFSAETMPLVTVPVRRSGEPMATTCSPTLRLPESPSRAGFRPLAPWSLIRARSLSGSVPTIFAGYFLPSFIVTWISEAPLTTWLLVAISPSAVRTTPEPVPWPDPVRVSMRTTEGLTCSATPATVPLLDCETLVPLMPFGPAERSPSSCCTAVAVAWGGPPRVRGPPGRVRWALRGRRGRRGQPGARFRPGSPSGADGPRTNRGPAAGRRGAGGRPR